MTNTVPELVLTRLIHVTPEQLFRCRTEPSLMKQWFAPAPVIVTVAPGYLGNTC